MMQYLGIIEQRSNQLLAAYAQQHPSQVTVASKHNPRSAAAQRDAKHNAANATASKRKVTAAEESALLAQLNKELEQDNSSAQPGADEPVQEPDEADDG